MPTSSPPRILIVGDDFPAPAAAALAEAGWETTAKPFAGIDPAVVAHSQAIVAAVGSASLQSAQALSRRWRIELGEQYTPIVWLASGEVSPVVGLDSGADVVLPDDGPADHLVAQLKSLLRVRHLQQRLAGRAGEAQGLNQRLQQAFQQIEGDSELTRRIHRGFLPATLPEVGGARFAVCYRPRSRIGGDFYDVVRLDEDHVGFYVADAMGRGLPASSLLSVFVKKGFAPKEIVGRSYRLVPPGEVLDKLNRDLLNLNLPEPPFVTMLYAQVNTRDGSLSFARAAHPHPLHLPVGGEPAYRHAAGTLLGVFESEFTVQTMQLQPGDKLVLFSDGVHPPSTGPGSLRDPLVESARKHRSLAVEPFVDAVARDLLEESKHPEDFTMLAVEFAA